MSFENRGGYPDITFVTSTAAGTIWPLSATTKFLQVYNTGANITRMYFELADFTADTNYIALAASTGYYEGPVEIATIYLRSPGGNTAVTVVPLMRRG